MAARPNMPRPIIVKKVIQEAHGGHHGGAWKVAYADFVTAMMAFFLLMWLLGSTTDGDKKGLQDYFQSVLSGADLPQSKPDPAVYLLSAERLAVQPANCVVLEDAASGVAAAKAAGMYCIAYRNPSSGCQDLSRADRIVEDVADIDLQRL